MTEPTEIVDDRAARLARLQARRGADPSVTPSAPSSADRPATAVRGPDSLPSPTAASIERTAPIDPPPQRTRRRSPAANAKIITIGASTTALLGMIAGYGIADGLTNEPPEATGSVPAAPAPIVRAAPIAPASPTTTPPAPVTTAPPQVIVVMVDAATGRPISTTTGSGEGVLESALGSLPGSTPAPAPAADDAAPSSSSAGTSAPAAPAAPAPAAPAAVDLAVPAAPQPAPAPAGPRPAPQPQASSGGS